MDAFNRQMYEEIAQSAGSFYENSNILPFIVLDAEEVEILEAIAIKKGRDEVERLLSDYSQLFLLRNEIGFVREALQFKNYLHSINYPDYNNPALFKHFDKIYKTALNKGFKKVKKIKNGKRNS